MSLLERLRDKVEKEYKREVSSSLALQSGVVGLGAGLGLGVLAGAPLEREIARNSRDFGAITRHQNKLNQIFNENRVFIPELGLHIDDVFPKYKTDGLRVIRDAMGVEAARPYVLFDEMSGGLVAGPKLSKLRGAYEELSTIPSKLQTLTEANERLTANKFLRRAGGALGGAALGVGAIYAIDKMKKNKPILGR